MAADCRRGLEASLLRELGKQEETAGLRWGVVAWRAGAVTRRVLIRMAVGRVAASEMEARGRLAGAVAERHMRRGWRLTSRRLLSESCWRKSGRWWVAAVGLWMQRGGAVCPLARWMLLWCHARVASSSSDLLALRLRPLPPRARPRPHSSIARAPCSRLRRRSRWFASRKRRQNAPKMHQHRHKRKTQSLSGPMPLIRRSGRTAMVRAVRV